MKHLITIGALAFAATALSGCVDDGNRHIHSTHGDRHHHHGDHHHDGDHDWDGHR